MKTALFCLLFFSLASCRTGSDGQLTSNKDIDTTTNWCSVGSVKVPAGQKFSALDGCNKCQCEDQGSGTFAVSCTELGCPALAVSDACNVDNQILIADGAKLPSIDGCNTCSCESGNLSCSELNGRTFNAFSTTIIAL